MASGKFLSASGNKIKLAPAVAGGKDQEIEIAADAKITFNQDETYAGNPVTMSNPGFLPGDNVSVSDDKPAKKLDIYRWA